MTRINLLDPSLLRRQELIAEYRELPRIFGKVKEAIARGDRPNNKRFPTTFRLGSGHMLFFYPRLRWLLERQKQVVAECLSRKYKITHTDPESLLEGIPREWIGDWTPTDKDVKVSLSRLIERQPDYYRRFDEETGAL